MPKHMATEKPRADAGDLGILTKDVANSGCEEPTMGDCDADKDLSRRGMTGSALDEVAGQSLAYRRQQR